MIEQSRPAPVDQSVLDDLDHRLSQVRPRRGAAPVLGIDPDRVESLVKTWQQVDWRAIEAELQGLGAAITRTADGRRLHYLHARAEGSGKTPIVLLHGWPDSALMFRKVMPLLVAAGHDVVAPTAAGFGLSDEPDGEMSPELVAEDVHTLMVGLGYSTYAVHGNDFGATVGAALASAHTEAVVALHLLQPPFDRAFLVDRETAGEAELAYLRHMDDWADNAAYISAHGELADTLAAAFDDSPVGLLAWVAEKYDAWSGESMTDEDIVATVATMWLTDSFRSSVRLYSEPASDWADWAEESDDGSEWGSEQAAGEAAWSQDAAAEWGSGRLEVPTAFAVFPQDIGQPPREFADRFFAIERYTVMPRGGHWAALEEAEMLAEDLITFLASR